MSALQRNKIRGDQLFASDFTLLLTFESTENLHSVVNASWLRRDVMKPYQRNATARGEGDIIIILTIMII